MTSEPKVGQTGLVVSVAEKNFQQILALSSAALVGQECRRWKSEVGATRLTSSYIGTKALEQLYEWRKPSSSTSSLVSFSVN
mmetsp:Transcript_28868/g.62815  ORF Transcript_28868/g.62815 Transcript_28868/m.62815 type:complete len:82 (+) Transcript_28868:341-586(+)